MFLLQVPRPRAYSQLQQFLETLLFIWWVTRRHELFESEYLYLKNDTGR